MYVCSCFGITEAQVKKHADAGACTPRQIASACKAGTDCGGCVRRIQALLGRDSSRRDLVGQQREPVAAAAVGRPMAMPVVAAVPVAATPDVGLPDAA
ncbi:bacterioferritin-associated ferredoxin [Streptomyces bacillaris]|uniref:Bacterioferritin-associated ferredoxin n=1 Tax=Streptomyces cavourensis TaxID=67258 RepID=A0AAD0Q2X4_9ACTN|nr:(2Fe-2S)-binding protein [Streptomyces cavourensis]AXI71155.1 (2Fe-2S)-binding protein [Streptomyces cavourensis]